MSSVRTLPNPARHREFAVTVDGQAIDRGQHLLQLSVVHEVGRLSAARLVFADGSAASGAFPLSDGGLFTAGAVVSVHAVAGDEQAPLFHGVVVQTTVQVREAGATRLVVECRHAAVALTLRRRSASYHDVSDGDVLEQLLGQAGLAAEVEGADLRHEQLVQYRASDWDFVVARAEANGLLVLTHAESVAVVPPDLGGEPVCTLTYGATIETLDAVVDARLQPEAVSGLGWDAAAQDALAVEGAEPDADGPGGVVGADLAGGLGAGTRQLRHEALPSEELAAWAGASWLRSRLSALSGTARCQGTAAPVPGALVTLSGLGERLSGDVLVTGVRHDQDGVRGWRTHIQFGALAERGETRRGGAAGAAGGLVPGVLGLHVGLVVDLEDPAGEQRVRVRLPLDDDDGGEGLWARLATVEAGSERGFVFRPEVGDEVVLGFVEADPRGPLILGALHSSAHPAPLEPSNANDERVIQSRSGMRVHFDDAATALRLDTPGGNVVLLSDDEQGATIEDQNGNRIVLGPDGISIESAGSLSLVASTELSLEGGTSLSGSAGSELKLEGSASAELSSSGSTTVKGSVVQIN